MRRSAPRPGCYDSGHSVPDTELRTERAAARETVMSKTKTFFIIGVGSGLGKAFAEGALAAGHRVIATHRNEDAASAFAAFARARAHAVLLDVTKFDAIPEAVARAKCEVGPIDVLVNNPGYGHDGILEESSLDDMRRQFDANVFGAVAMIEAILPGMQARRSGLIVNVTSMGGFIPCLASAITVAESSHLKASPRRLAKN